MIKLVAIDVDDTLLNSKGELLASTIQVIGQAVNKGVKVVLCSGRPLAGVQGFLKQLKIQQPDQYVITFNGAVIESVTGEKLSQKGLTKATYQLVDTYSKEHELAYNVLDADSRIYTSNQDVNWVTVIQAWENQAGILIRQPQMVADDTTMIKAVFVGDKSELDRQEAEVKQTFGQDNYVVRAAANFLEIMHADVNKGIALKTLSQKLGFTPQEVMAMGDEQNDIPMFDFAQTAVAMGNGSDLAKQHATYVTQSNDQDGIAQAFEKFIL